MIHAHQNYPKPKLHHVMVVRVCTVNGQNGPSVVPIALVEFLVVCNTMIVALNQLSKNVLVELIAGQPGPSGPLAHLHVLDKGLDVKLTSAVLIQSKKLKPVVPVVISSAGHHGVSVVKNVKAVSHLEIVFINVASLQKKNQRPVDAPVTMDSGRPGLNAVVQMVPLSFAEAVSDVDHVKVSVVTWTKFKMLNVTPKDVVTITHGLTGHHAVPLVDQDIKNGLSQIAMVWLFKLTVKDVPILLSSPNGPNGAPAVQNVEMVL